MNIKFKGLGFFSVIILTFLFLPHLVSAQTTDTGTTAVDYVDPPCCRVANFVTVLGGLAGSSEYEVACYILASSAPTCAEYSGDWDTVSFVSCRTTPACSSLIPELDRRRDDAEKAKEIKDIEAANDAISDLTNWTCVLTYEGEAPGLNRGVSATKINVDKICVDYKNLASTMAVDRDAARQLCYQNCDAGATQDANRAKSCLFILTQTCSQYASNPSASGSGYDGPDFSDLNNELGATTRGLNKLGLSSPSALIGRLIRVAVGIIGTIALVIFVYAGLVWMTSRGDSSKAESSRSMLLWASLGVVVILSSYAIVDFIFGTVFK
ncbi:MAG: hypothetical protein KBD73_02710 [Candidatus Magasanikbacteria bacterium]|nr:hypothetical protein [Candidatus Magasanikbacteria bacterium]